MAKAIPADERFWAKVQGGDVGQCWTWTGGKDPAGYGWFGDHGTHTVRAHRWSYQQLIADIPPGLQLDHLCRNTSCVNPWHLDPVTQAVNAARGERPQRTHCPYGHPYDEANTYWHGRNRNQRACRECDRARQRHRYHQLKKQAAA